MEKTKYRTLVKYDHEKYGRNSYVKGLIAGYLDILCGIKSPWKEISDIGVMIETKCPDKAYEVFRTKVEKRYPGLCEFDYHFSE